VAREFRCTDGTNPFAGDVRQAMNARSGSRPAANGHHIDSYEVPCAGGTVTVYVDMYGCDEMAPPSDELPRAAKELLELFRAGDLAGLLGKCTALELREGRPGTEQIVCAMTLPVVRLAFDENHGATVEQTCSGLPPASPKSDARKLYLTLVFAALDFHRTLPNARLSDEQVARAKVRFASACGITPESVPSASFEELF
jgi:hypothetical protein